MYYVCAYISCSVECLNFRQPLPTWSASMPHTMEQTLPPLQPRTIEDDRNNQDMATLIGDHYRWVDASPMISRYTSHSLSVGDKKYCIVYVYITQPVSWGHEILYILHSLSVGDTRYSICQIVQSISWGHEILYMSHSLSVVDARYCIYNVHVPQPVSWGCKIL